MIRICNLWSTGDTKWSEGNWTWGECQLVAELCQKWGETKYLWSLANWKWSECSSSIQPEPPIVVSIGNQPGVDATTLIQPWMIEEPWNPYKNAEKKKRLIKLICKVKGHSYNEEKEAKDIDVTIDDIRMVVKAVANIDLNFKLEE